MTVRRVRMGSWLRPLLALTFVVLALPASDVFDLGAQDPPRAFSACGTRGAAVMLGADLASCVHEDIPPPGVDVTEPVSTAELRRRPGAGPASFEAAQDLGVPSVEVATNVASPLVPCDGDGTSGYRIQAMYVVEAGRTNRYADLLANLRLWAAGTDDVINRSAALTGGVRHLRYVTEPGSGGCVAKVLNVTVPNGSMASFGATIAAVQALGYTDPTRKYLMWTDATVLCGVANMYTTDADSQANPNNGGYAQYARVDSGCWGFGNGAEQHSVEAHEILHTLGGVQNSAPRSTRAGHCWDEADTMCYADGSGYAMRQICPPAREYFFDCNNDDYFSTFPDPGGYLDTHWNSADSRFLIGGGDGSGGGTAGTPTVLGATIAVNNPAIPGLPTQVSVTPAVPAGRSLTKVAWKSARSDCVFGTPSEVQSTVTCSATSTAATTVTVTLTDSTGATKAVTSPLTFSTSGSRPVSIALEVDSQTGSSVGVCTGAVFPVRVVVIDSASGQPVKGLTVTVTRKTAAMTAPTTAGSGSTTVAGLLTLSQSATTSTAYVARTAATTVYAAATGATTNAVAATCSPTLSATTDKNDVYYADPVAVSGLLTRQVAGSPVPVSGATLSVRLTYVSAGVTRMTTLSSTKTAADGSYRVVVKPTVSGSLSVALAGSTAYTATVQGASSVTVRVPLTDMEASVDKTDVGHGGTVTVTGSLDRVAGGATTPLASQTVSVLVTPPGKAPVTVATGRTTAGGTFTVPVALKVTGTMSVKYAGVAGQPAAQVTVGSVVAGTWATQLTATAPTTSAPYGTTVTLTGSLTRSYGGVTEGAKGVALKVMFRANGSSTTSQVGSATTTTGGAISVRVYARTSGTFTVVLTGVAGYTPASSAGVPLTVT